MKVFVAIMLVLTVFLSISTVFAADVAAGKDLYGKRCASCHGTAGEGKDSIAKAMKVEMKPLSSQEVQSKSDADLKKIMLEGIGKMKGTKDLDAKGADDIVAYLRTLKK